jgi:hypothetical protein
VDRVWSFVSLFFAVTVFMPEELGKGFPLFGKKFGNMPLILCSMSTCSWFYWEESWQRTVCSVIIDWE